jgi:hypothetical protein
VKEVPALSDRTIELLVDVEQGRASSGDLASWAVDALEQGLDTPALRMVAASRRGEPVVDALPYFWRALRELGIGKPHGEALLREYAAVLARQVLAATLPAADAVSRMHRRVVTPLDHPADLMPWCYLWEGIDPNDFRDLAELSEAEYGQLVREAAQALVGGWQRTDSSQCAPN